MVRHNNQLPHNLPQLQNLIKRDPSSYAEEYKEQYEHFCGLLEIFALNPSSENHSLEEVVMFIAQVLQCYPDDCKDYSQKIVNLLKSYSTSLNSNMRSTFVKALILIRNKNLFPAQELMELFFQMLHCPDKSLRKFLQNHIVTDIKNMNTKHKDMKLNSNLQSFMFKMLNDAFPRSAKMSVDIMVELFKKNIWNDAKTVNAIATVGCFSKYTKVRVASLKFFLGHDDENEGSDDDSDNEIDLKGAIMQNRVNKKTKKRKKQLEQIKKQAVKAAKKKKNSEPFNFSGIHLVHNPQGMAEDLFKQLESGNERFEVKLMHLDVISRLIGIHNLFVFRFYSYVTRFIEPHQRQVTRILQFAAQASHALIPGEIIEPILKKIANNFITERHSSDVMAIGLNAVREICLRCPLAMGEDLLQDLSMYKTYKDKSVFMAARSLIMLYRDRLPKLLAKKDRGRQTEAQAERKALAYGEIEVHTSVPGAEVLLNDAKEIDDENTESEDDEDDDDDYDDDDDDDDDDDVDEDSDDDDDSISKDENKSNENGDSETQNGVQILNKAEAAQELALTRIFTDADFKRINAANVKKAVTGSKKRAHESEKTEFVKLDNIEMIYKKRKHDKSSRLQTVLSGREDREKFGYKDGRKNENCSKTNKEKRKNKNFVMMRLKAKSKVKKSFKEKQQALRNYLLKQKKMK